MPGEAHIGSGTVSGTAGGWIGTDEEDDAASKKGISEKESSGMVFMNIQDTGLLPAPELGGGCVSG